MNDNLAIEKALSEAKRKLSHSTYSVLKKAIEKEPEVNAPPVGSALFVSVTALDSDVHDTFQAEYCTKVDHAMTCSIDGADPALLPSLVKSIEPSQIFALGSEAYSTLEKAGVKAIYLPHPHAYKADPKKTQKKINEIFKGLEPDSGEPIECTIKKTDEAKQIVYSVVLDGYQFDAHGDYIPPSEIEKTAHEWMRKSRVIGLNHEEFGKSVDAHVVESYVERYPSDDDYRNAMKGVAHKAFKLPFGDDTVHSGSWVIGIKLGDELWKKHQDGELNAVSIGGFGTRKAVTKDHMPEVKFIELTEAK